MTDESAHPAGPAAATSAPDRPAAVDRATFQAELDALRVREQAHTRGTFPVSPCKSRRAQRPVTHGTPLRAVAACAARIVALPLGSR